MNDIIQREPAISPEDAAAYRVAGRLLAEAWRKGRASQNIILQVKDRLPIAGVTIRGAFRDIHRAENGLSALWRIDNNRGPTIHIGLPTDGLPSEEGDQFCQELAPYLAGVAIHEYVHWLQKGRWPVEYEEYASEQTRWRKSLDGRAPDSDSVVLNYYTNPFELAAHAAQVASEVLWTGKRLEETELVRHIRHRLGGVDLPANIQHQLQEAAGRYSIEMTADILFWGQPKSSEDMSCATSHLSRGCSCRWE